MAITVTREDRPHAEVALAGVLPATLIEAQYEKAVANAARHVIIPGFRKGHAPREKVIEQAGEGFLWKEAAERALKDELDEIIKNEKLIPIIPLSLSFKKAEPRGDIEFEIVAVTPPLCSIEKYKEVARRALEALPKEDGTEEKEKVVQAFRTQVRAIIKIQKPDGAEGVSGSEDTSATAILDDEAKRAGFENGEAAEFFIRGEAEKAVENRAEQRKRSVVADALLKESTCAVPRVIVNEEALALLEAFKRDVAAQGLLWSDYLKRVGKTEDQVRNDLAPNAEKRIALDLIFGYIIREEKLEFSDEDTKKADELTKKLVEQGVPRDRAHQHARESFLREKVWEALSTKTELR